MITYVEDVDNENINISNHSEPDAIINIKSNLLKPPERLKVGNRLIEDCKLYSQKMNFLVFIRNKIFYMIIE